MKLTRFSQEVDVSSGSLDDVLFFAVFQSDDGRELKLPISKEASEAIIVFIGSKPEKKQAPVTEPLHNEEPPSDEDRGLATIFDENDPQYVDPNPEPELDSEGKVPSV